jgi:CBS domain-containing protein
MPKCKDVMTKNPVCCEPGDSISLVADIMKQQDVGSVPVVESKASNRLVGIVTDRDLVVKVLAGGRGIDGVTVRDAMTTNPASCREEDDVDQAIDLMADRQIRRVPIVDASGRVCGIIAQADVATRVNRDDRTGELVEAISDANSGATGSGKPQF